MSNNICTKNTSLLQTPSTRNSVAERIWSEVDSRVNCPVKFAMNDIVERNNIDLSDPVSKSGVEHFVHAWKHHKISGPKGCVPTENMI